MSEVTIDGTGPGPAGTAGQAARVGPAPAAAPTTAVPAAVTTPTVRAAGTDRAEPLGGWPLGWRSVGAWFAAYAALTALWAGSGRWLVAASGAEPREVAVNRWFEARRTPTLDGVTGWLSRTADVGPKLALIALFGLVFVVLWRRLDDTVFLVGVMSLEVTSFVTTTALVSRARPDVLRLDASPPTSSFPSGHVAATTALYLALATVAWWHAHSRRWPAATVTALAVLGVVAVALARLYRGMHYLTDVSAGALLGLAAIALGSVVLEVGRRARARRTGPDQELERRLDHEEVGR